MSSSSSVSYARSPRAPQSPLSNAVASSRGASPELARAGRRASVDVVDLISRGKSKSSPGRRLGNIKQDDYAKLLTLKLAGRQNKEIAAMFDVPTEHVLPHITRAIGQYRNGELEADSYAVANEGKEKEKEKGFDLAQKLDSAIEQSTKILQEIESAYLPSVDSEAAEVPSPTQNEATPNVAEIDTSIATTIDFTPTTTSPSAGSVTESVFSVVL